jgi:hypothetical protein
MFNPVITSKVTPTNGNSAHRNRPKTGHDPTDLLADSPVDQILKLNASPSSSRGNQAQQPHTHIPLIEKIKKKKAETEASEETSSAPLGKRFREEGSSLLQ